MHRLTSKLLDNYPYSHYATPQTIQRGRAYQKDGRVWNTELVNDQKAICIVDGNSGEYTVEIEIDKKTGELSFECECYFAEEGNFCKHMVAAALEVSGNLDDHYYEDEGEEEPAAPAPTTKEAAGDWKTKLMQSVALMPRQSAGGNRLIRYALAVTLKRNRGYFYSSMPSQYTYSLDIQVIKENEWQPLENVVENSPQEINTLLETNKSWIKVNQSYFQNLNPKGALNISEEAVAFINIFKTSMQMYGNNSAQLSGYLSMISRLAFPYFWSLQIIHTRSNAGFTSSRSPFNFKLTCSRMKRNSACKRALKITEPSPTSKRRSR
ncbi:MAG: hypothetical protein Q8L72_11690 [Moraxellaceae bacterium]|nr:hypothetical protein [Moraxellaceae bacterium]